jgi:hypothetical protein
MSLTSVAYEERMWGEFPILRFIVKQAKVADHHYGPLTASDNVFDRVERQLKIALIVPGNKEAVTAALKDDVSGRIAKDLREAMNWAKSNCFGRSCGRNRRNFRTLLSSSI